MLIQQHVPVIVIVIVIIIIESYTEYNEKN